MKVLMVPEFELRAASRVETRECARCGGERAILTLMPQSVRVPWDGSSDEVLVAARNYSSRSGLTFCEPIAMAASADATLRYRDHRRLYLAAWVGVVPAELFLDCSGYTRLARFRDDYDGVKGEYCLLARKVLDLPAPTDEDTCPPCRIAAIDRARESGKRIAEQGHLEVYPYDDVALSGAGWNDPWGNRFFNHTIVAPTARAIVHGRIALLQSDEEITITSPDHPDETVRIAAGRYWLYHPWPRRNADVD
jgi:hypothetical protein